MDFFRDHLFLFLFEDNPIGSFSFINLHFKKTDNRLQNHTSSRRRARFARLGTRIIRNIATWLPGLLKWSWCSWNQCSSPFNYWWCEVTLTLLHRVIIHPSKVSSIIDQLQNFKRNRIPTFLLEFWTLIKIYFCLFPSAFKNPTSFVTKLLLLSTSAQIVARITSDIFNTYS